MARKALPACPASLAPLTESHPVFGAWPWLRRPAAQDIRDCGADTAWAIALSPLPKVDRAAAVRGARWAPERAARVCLFIERMCKHTDGAHYGTPFQILPWQRDLLCRLFGWLRPDGTRRFRQAYVQIPKKNGKSALMSALGLYLTVFDGERSAEVVCAATTRDQARIVFDESAKMARLSPQLGSRLLENRAAKRLSDEQTMSYMVAISADAGTAEGRKSSAVIIDELHAHPNRRLFDALRYAGVARRQPLLLVITTAGYDRHSVCYEQLEYARKVADGSVADDSFLPIIYAADESPDGTKHEGDFNDPEVFLDPAAWHRANPSLGITLSEDDFRAEALEAAASPAAINRFLRYRLNIWTDAADRWIGSADWDACGEHSLPTATHGWPAWEDAAKLLDAAIASGRPAYMGLDLSDNEDTTAAAVLVPPTDDQPALLLVRCWVPTENASKRETMDGVPYMTWARDHGRLMMTEGNVQHFEAVAKGVAELARRFRIRKAAIDPARAIGIEQALEADGVSVSRVYQGISAMAAPSDRFEQLIRQRRLRHFGCPVMRWMIANTVAEVRVEGTRPSKKKSTERIDGVIASVLAVAQWMTGDDGISVYERRMARGEPVITVI